MKRNWIKIIAVVFALNVCFQVNGQSTDTAAVIAAREEAEERYKKMFSAIEELQAAQVLFKKRLDELEARLNEIQQGLSRLTNNLATRAEIIALGEKLIALDKERQEDKKLIVEQLSKLGASLKNLSSAPAPPPSNTAPKVEKGYEYVIQPGDTLSKIVKMYRDEGIKVSMQQIIDANPGLNPNSLKIGQKIFIPHPGK